MSSVGPIRFERRSASIDVTGMAHDVPPSVFDVLGVVGRDRQQPVTNRVQDDPARRVSG